MLAFAVSFEIRTGNPPNSGQELQADTAYSM